MDGVETAYRAMLLRAWVWVVRNKSMVIMNLMNNGITSVGIDLRQTNLCTSYRYDGEWLEAQDFEPEDRNVLLRFEDYTVDDYACLTNPALEGMSLEILRDGTMILRQDVLDVYKGSDIDELLGSTWLVPEAKHE